MINFTTSSSSLNRIQWEQLELLEAMAEKNFALARTPKLAVEEAAHAERERDSDIDSDGDGDDDDDVPGLEEEDNDSFSTPLGTTLNASMQKLTPATPTANSINTSLQSQELPNYEQEFPVKMPHTPTGLTPQSSTRTQYKHTPSSAQRTPHTTSGTYRTPSGSTPDGSTEKVEQVLSKMLKSPLPLLLLPSNINCYITVEGSDVIPEEESLHSGSRSSEGDVSTGGLMQEELLKAEKWFARQETEEGDGDSDSTAAMDADDNAVVDGAEDWKEDDVSVMTEEEIVVVPYDEAGGICDAQTDPNGELDLDDLEITTFPSNAVNARNVALV